METTRLVLSQFKNSHIPNWESNKVSVPKIISKREWVKLCHINHSGLFFCRHGVFVFSFWTFSLDTVFVQDTTAETLAAADMSNAAFIHSRDIYRWLSHCVHQPTLPMPAAEARLNAGAPVTQTMLEMMMTVMLSVTEMLPFHLPYHSSRCPTAS